MKKMKFTSDGELANKLLNHLIRVGMNKEQAERRVAIYYNLGGSRTSSQHP